MPAWLGWLLTVLFVALAFMIFRAPDMSVVWNMTAGALGGGGVGRRWDVGVAAAACDRGRAGAAEAGPTRRRSSATCSRIPAVAVATALAAVYVMLEVGRGAPSSFIYFQF